MPSIRMNLIIHYLLKSNGSLLDARSCSVEVELDELAVVEGWVVSDDIDEVDDSATDTVGVKDIVLEADKTRLVAPEVEDGRVMLVNQIVDSIILLAEVAVEGLMARLDDVDSKETFETEDEITSFEDNEDDTLDDDDGVTVKLLRVETGEEEGTATIKDDVDVIDIVLRADEDKDGPAQKDVIIGISLEVVDWI